MKSLRSRAPLLLTVLAACSSTGNGPAVQAPSPAAAYAAPRNDDALVLYSAGAQAWFADPKDARLRAALALIEKRVAELPAELDQPEMPVDPILLAIEMLSRPMALRADLVEGPQSGALPFRAQWSFDLDTPVRATELARRFADLLQEHGLPTLGKSEATHGMQVLPLGPVSAFHGVLAPERARTFAIAVGEPKLDELTLGSLDLPANVRPFLAWKLDYGAYFKAIGMMAGLAGGDGGPLATENPLAMFGMEKMVVIGGLGHGTDRMYGSMRTQEYVSSARTSGMLPSGPLSAREISIVPADATWATLGRVDPRGWIKLARTVFAAQAESNGMPPDMDPIALVAAFTGFDLEQQLFDHMGETWGMYASDTTGGGGVASLVAFLQVQNEPGLVESFGWAENELNEALKTHAEGYVALERRDLGTVPAWQLSFLGIPVPVEITLALDGGYLFAGLHRQAIEAALAQARSGEGGLALNPGFRAFAGSRLDDLYSISFCDTPRLARDGYALVALASSALANGTRSRTDSTRDAGSILPAYHALLDDALATVGLGRLSGDDLVFTFQADRSWLVNSCGIAGMVGGLPAAGAIAAAIAAAMEHEAGTVTIEDIDAEAEMEVMEELDGFEVETMGEETAPEATPPPDPH